MRIGGCERLNKERLNKAKGRGGERCTATRRAGGVRSAEAAGMSEAARPLACAFGRVGRVGGGGGGEGGAVRASAP